MRDDGTRPATMDLWPGWLGRISDKDEVGSSSLPKSTHEEIV